MKWGCYCDWSLFGSMYIRKWDMTPSNPDTKASFFLENFLIRSPKTSVATTDLEDSYLPK